MTCISYRLLPFCNYLEEVGIERAALTNSDARIFDMLHWAASAHVFYYYAVESAGNFPGMLRVPWLVFSTVSCMLVPTNPYS